MYEHDTGKGTQGPSNVQPYTYMYMCSKLCKRVDGVKHGDRRGQNRVV